MGARPGNENESHYRPGSKNYANSKCQAFFCEKIPLTKPGECAWGHSPGEWNPVSLFTK